jgi:hypothetical protein
VAEAQAPDRAVRSRWASYLRGLVEYGVPSLGLIALLLYAGARTAYDNFYGQLDLRPEDVGITYFTIVARAGLGAVYLFGLLALLTIVLYAYVPFDWISRLIHEPGTRAVIGGALTMLLGALAFLEENAYPARQTPHRADLFASACGLGFVVVGLAIMRRNRRGIWHKVHSLHRAENTVLLLTIFLAVAVVVIFSQGYGVTVGKQVADGAPVPSTRFSSLFDLQADRVCAAWVGSDRPASLDLSTSLFLLGEADGTMVLYRPRSRSDAKSVTRVAGPIRAPVAKVVLTPSQTGRSTCA